MLSLLIAILSVTGHGPPDRWCSASPVAAHVASRIVDAVSGRGAEAELSRRQFNLPELPADSVIVVTDERMCERAARTYYRHELGPMPAGGVTVLRVGNRYVVSGAIRAGEWTITTVYSAQLEGIVSILM
jgi:hypothetical protein